MSGNCSVPSIPLFLMQVILNISIEQCNFISKYVESGRNVVTYNYPQIVLSSIQLFMFSSSLHTNDHGNRLFIIKLLIESFIFIKNIIKYVTQKNI